MECEEEEGKGTGGQLASAFSRFVEGGGGGVEIWGVVSEGVCWMN